MTDLASHPHVLDTPALALGEAVAAGLAALPGLRAEPLDGDPTTVVPGVDSRAVTVDVGDGARLVLALAPGAARRVQVGPPPAEDLLDGCRDALTTAAAALGIAETGPVLEVPVGALAPGEGEAAVACALLEEGDVVGVVAVVAPEPAAPADEPAAAVHEFAALPDDSPALAASGLELLHDVTLGVTAELGRTSMLVRDVLSLAPGAVIELDRAAGSPVDVLVNGTLIARGEVVVIDEEFGIRITEVVGYDDGRRR